MEVLSVMSLEQVPIQYTGIVQLEGGRQLPYSVWVGGVIYYYNKTLAQSEIDLAKEFSLLDRYGSFRDRRRANRA